jgi:DNA-binding HxlR family transcriptional regulator
VSKPAVPGHPVRGSRTGRPIMALFDVLGQRWTLRIMWELHRASPLTFRALQEHCGGLSSSVLSRRLDVLREVRLVATGKAGYELSELGEELVDSLGPVLRWSERWASALH